LSTTDEPIRCWKLSRVWNKGPTPEMGDRGRRVHDKDVLEAIGAQPFDGQVWRVTRSGRDPARGSAANGRWSPKVNLRYSTPVWNAAAHSLKSGTASRWNPYGRAGSFTSCTP